MGDMKVVFLSCAVMRDLVGPHLDEGAVDTIYMDFGLHEKPKSM